LPKFDFSALDQKTFHTEFFFNFPAGLGPVKLKKRREAQEGGYYPHDSKRTGRAIPKNAKHPTCPVVLAML